MSEYPADLAADAVDEGISFSEDVIAMALENIYRKTFNVKTEIEPNLFKDTVRIFNLASATGISDAINEGTPSPSDAFLLEIKNNNEVFAVFRTHRMQNDIARLMMDAEGKLKSFSKFAQDVKPYTDHQNKNWLRTEFNTAVLRAHQAANWKQFEAERDVFPNLEWVKTTSPDPGADHRIFWGTIRPIDDPFWDIHRPGDRWNCKCSLRNTDKEPTAIPQASDTDKPNNGLENNPGKDGKIFSDNHPYFPKNCKNCPISKRKGLVGLFFSLRTKPKNCYDCKFSTGCAEATKFKQRYEENKALFDIYKNDENYIDVDFDEISGGLKATHVNHNFDEYIGRFGIKRGEYEKITRDALFKSGYRIILRPEVGDGKQPDGYINDILMDIKGVEGNSLYSMKRANKQGVDCCILYFHDKSKYDRNVVEENFRNFPSWLNYVYKRNIEVTIKSILCVVNNGNGGFFFDKIENPQE